jgi:hypothetical protein
MTNKITDILGYEFTKTGGTIVLKFSNNWITKRSFMNVLIEHTPKKCALSGEEIKVGNTAIFIQIKKQGFTRYWLSQESVNKALSGEFHETPDNSPDIVKALLGFLDGCGKERKEMIKEDQSLREALANLKFKNSKLSKKMTAAHQLLELVSKK